MKYYSLHRIACDLFRRDKDVRTLLALSVVIGVAANSASVMAQASGNGTSTKRLEEVVVSARKRSESMFDVPMSINVVGEQFIERVGAQDFTDLLTQVPSLTAYQNGPGRTRIFIRGIANGAGNDNDTQNQETVSIYLDDIPISLGAMNPELALFDLERVEVLRGPQGTLFGAGAMAGTIRQISRKPEFDQFGGKVEFDAATIAHGSESYSVKGMVNVPLASDRVAVRASGYYSDFGGYIDNVLTGENDVNNGVSKGVRISARALVTDSLMADLTFMTHDYSDNGRPEDLDATPFLTRNYPSFDGYDDEMDVYNLTLSYDLGWAELTSSSSYFDREIVNRRSLDLLFELALPPGITPSELVDTTELDVFSQEIRLSSAYESPLQWTVGAYYDKKDTLYLNTFPVPGVDAVLGIPSAEFGAPDDHLFFGFDDLTVETYAFFGEAYYTLGDFTITGGLRYFNWEQDIKFFQSGFFNGGASDDPRPKGSVDDVNPKLNIAYDISDESLVYVQAARGFRYGGINGAIPEAVCADELAEVDREGGDVRFFDPDKLWSYEIGNKGSLANGRLSYNAAYFYNEWEDMQTTRSFTCGFGFRENVGKVISQGVELEINAQPTEHLSLGLGGSFVSSELDEDVPNLNASKGDQAPYVPELSLNAWAEYTRPLGGGVEGFLWGNVVYVDDRHTEFNQDPGTIYRRMDSYSLANLRLGVNWNSLEVSLYANNLFDDDGVVRALRRPPFDPDAVIRVQPRTVGLTLRSSF